MVRVLAGRAWRSPLGAGLQGALLAALLAGAARAQDADDAEIRKAGPTDPYAATDAEMAAAGIVAHAPFAWADFKTTADVDRVLGEGRMLWLETRHLCIGGNLPSFALPKERAKRDALLQELDALHAVMPNVPKRPKRLDPWLRMHLFALRAERCYADFQALLGVTDQDFPTTGDKPGQGPYLGQPGKFLLLLFQKKSDLARYCERFCAMTKDESTRYHHPQTWQMVAIHCCEGLELFDDAALHRYVCYSLTHNFLNGYRGFYYQLPLWFEEGLSHWFARQVESEFVSFRKDPTEAINRMEQHLWPQKVRARLGHAEFLVPFDQVVAWTNWEDMGYHDHLQAWSRVDYLMQHGQAEVGLFLQHMKSLPPLSEGEVPITKAEIDAAQLRLMQQIWQLDGPGFDRAWRDWVLATYPKK